MKRFPVRSGVAYALILGLGLLVAEVVVPALISAAYRGESLSFLNDMISGQSQHPVDFYLAEWRRFARGALIAVTILVALVYAWWLLRPATTRLGDRFLSGVPELSASRVIWLAAWFGAVTGLIEALHFLGRHWIERHPARGFAWELVWLGPLSTTIAFSVAGALLVLAFRLLVHHPRLLRPVALPVCVFAFSLLAAYGVLQNPRLRLAPYAVILLSLGLAAALARLSRSHSRGFLRAVRLTTPPVAALLLAGLALGLWTMPSRLEQRRLARLGPAEPGSPNVLFIILDTARAQSMSLYGHHRPTTPNLERFAEQGVVFDQAIATSSWTLPSHASMFTGRYHFEVSADIGIPLDDTHPMLTEVLRDRGYATAAFTANKAYTTEASGLARGFARYEDYSIGWGQFLSSSWFSRTLVSPVVDLHAAHWRIGRKFAGPNTDDFLGWLSTRPDRPFFVFINYIDPHRPYLAPEPFGNMFVTPGMPAPVRDKIGPVTKAQVEGSRAAYDGTIANIDHHLGRLFEALRAQGILDRTIVIVTADHGEQFGEHGQLGHGGSLYMPVLRVPLVVVYPASVPASTRIAHPVSIRDIPATILELVRGGASGGLPGASLSRFWTTASGADGAAGASAGWTDDATLVLSEANRSVITRDWEPLHRGSMKSVVMGDFHYILNGDGVEELYLLSEDPDEERDLSDAPQMSAVLEKARASLDSVLSR